jgi:excisionase family DNA binding protein
MIVLEDEFLTPRAIAEQLHVDHETVLRWLRTHQLAGYQVGKQWRVSLTDYTKFLKERRNKEGEGSSE